MLLLIIIAFCAFAVLILHWCSKSNPAERGLRGCKRVLFVVAHPDDEAMFFGPSILGLTDQGIDTYLLCLSSGNYRRQGLIRKKELRKSCSVLGIPDNHLMMVEHSRLPDDPHLLWNKTIVNDIILRHVEQLGIDTVVSFDDWGVSGHRNHAAISNSLRNLYSHGKFPVDTQIFVLESVNLFRKYIGLCDLAFSLLLGRFCFVSGWKNYFRSCKAMLCHRSQLLWFRVLYIIFSRYMIINTLRRIAPDKVVLKPYQQGKGSKDL